LVVFDSDQSSKWREREKYFKTRSNTNNNNNSTFLAAKENCSACKGTPNHPTTTTNHSINQNLKFFKKKHTHTVSNLETV
jgi:hypothetical protein